MISHTREPPCLKSGGYSPLAIVGNRVIPGGETITLGQWLPTRRAEGEGTVLMLVKAPVGLVTYKGVTIRGLKKEGKLSMPSDKETCLSKF